MVAGLVLAALVVFAAVCPMLGRIGAVLLALMSVLWLLVNRSMEGVVIVPVTRLHGLTSADLAGLAGIAVAVWVWLAAGRPRRD
ncbi:hypothetical protein ACT8ZV_22455 [Nocardioides sp. MAHUQ-72]|uniref:hypothetical protein n=1 Tax=unclassified Nocardioides TaxID=2615069 RepID=UPI0036180075